MTSEPRLLRFSTPSEFRDRAAFADGLNPNTTGLERIIGGYSFPQDLYVRCGLSTCRRTHGRGFLVQTADGRETNIGRDCGRTHFGARWEELERTFSKRQDIEARQDRIQELLRNRDELLERSRQLLEPVRRSEAAVKRVLGEVGKEKALHLAFRNSVRERGVLSFDRQLTEQQRQMTGSPGRFVKEVVGHLHGIRATESKDLGNRLHYEVIEQLRSITPGAMQELKDKALDAKVKWIGELESLLSLIPEFIRDAARFTSTANWAGFSLLFLPGRVPLNDRGRRVLARLCAGPLEGD